MKVYKQEDEDNGRWEGFEFRAGDVVIDAPSKSGTTWTQLLVALLVFDGPDFPAPLGQVSLWLEKRTRSAEEAFAAFAAQEHRRFIKSHTPLDGIPIRDEVRYIGVGRDPRDAAVSMMHHSDNMDRKVWAELTGQEPPDPESSPPVRTTEERFDGWLDGGPYPDWSARFLLHHYRTFWDHRHLPNVELFHFDDYRRDLAAQVVRLAAHLDIPITPERAAEVADEASIERSRDRAADIVPEAHLGIWKDTARFFRSGRSGEWRDVMTPAQQERYERIVADEVGDDLAHWIHHGSE